MAQDTSSQRILKSNSGNDKKYLNIINNIQQLVFSNTNNLQNYSRNQIKIKDDDVVFTYFLEGKKSKDVTFYISHGFGGSSLMFFPIFNRFLEKGNIVLWEIRGMGVGIKNQYQQILDSQINQFYVEGLRSIIKYYNHNKIIFVCHSLSAYITLRYLIMYPEDQRVTKAILMSPIGLTSKERDNKNTIKSCSDVMDALLNSFGWRFRLTFKSPLRTVCCCLKNKILKKAFSQFSLTEQQKSIMVQLFLTLIKLPDGSENTFFRYFLPRVLPREGQSIEELFQKGEKIDRSVSIYYGGDSDWVDQKGGEFLSQKLPNFRITNFREGGHMFCLNPELMQNLFSQQIK